MLYITGICNPFAFAIFSASNICFAAFAACEFDAPSSKNTTTATSEFS